MRDTPEKEQQAQQILTQLHTLVRRYSEQADAEIQVGALITEFREALGLKPTAFARHLSVAPQTVGRWEKNESRPRLSQMRKFDSLLVEQSVMSPTTVGGTEGEIMERLGIRLPSSIKSLESQAKAVWLFKVGHITGREREIFDEVVLGVLKSGGDVHYVFFQHTAEQQSFRLHLKQWVRTEPLLGTVTGYFIKEFRLAYMLGLAASPVAWMVIEYWPDQVKALSRQADVFAALWVRDYEDAALTKVKNKVGQPCWLELPTRQAGSWLKKIARLKAKMKSKGVIEVICLQDHSS